MGAVADWLTPRFDGLDFLAVCIAFFLGAATVRAVAR